MRLELWGGFAARGGVVLRPACADYKSARRLQACPTLLRWACCTLNVIGDLVLMDGDIPALASLGYRGN